MEALDPAAGLMMDDLLNFSSDIGEEDDDDDKTKAPSSSSLESNPNSQDPDDHSGSFPEFAEEELEWLSNKDAFPAVETCFDILSNNTGIVTNHHSPVSVLANSSSSSNSSTITSCCGGVQVPTNYPVRARSKRRRRWRRGVADLPGQQCWSWSQASIKNTKQEVPLMPPPTSSGTTIGRRCQHCQAEKTPQWRAGPMGPKTLCNACGVRYKSGRLVPEYRPASSPTFSSAVHSNSHRKIMEMRRENQPGAMVVNEAYGYMVG
uniref:Putative Zinc finger, GATA-type n=1 Tax=Davidia involucrata TaxID=16924 RepID=A0A5B7A8J9_DAVIN